MTDFNYQNIENAFSVIKDQIVRTPLVTNDYINRKLNANIYFKLENLQKTGSFKYRGASNKISKLTKSQKKMGVVAYSSGNHAQAVAYACFKKKISAKIIMPNNAPKVKIINTKKFNAEVVLYDPNTEIRESIGTRIAENENRTIIKPYDDYNIIAGQGTAAIEIDQDLKKFSIIPDIYLCCCGGGGLIAGTSTYLKHIYPNIKSYCVEPEGFDDTILSLRKGKIIKNKCISKTICDALLAPQPGNKTFPINLKNLNGGFYVTDEEVKNVIPFLAEHLKVVVEPGGAVAATALLSRKIEVKRKNVIVMLSGGNIDLTLFKKL
tara:strand:+ start:25129 stop:26094 length:966 start_codon:yes stop_codon:yes gene_type:complete